MIVICNGLYKSGSTLTFGMMRSLLGDPDAALVGASSLNPQNVDLRVLLSPGFDPERAGEVVVKAHVFDPLVLRRLRARGARLLFNDRDTPSILRSHHHHFSNERLRLPFLAYLATVGLVKAMEVEVFRREVIEGGFADAIVRYATSREEWVGEVHSAARRIGLPVTRAEVEAAFERRYLVPGASVSERTGMTGREWFAAREDRAPSVVERFFTRAVSRTAAAVVVFPVLGVLVRCLFVRLRHRWARGRSAGTARPASR